MGFFPLADPRRVGAAKLPADLVSGSGEGRKRKECLPKKEWGRENVEETVQCRQNKCSGTALFTRFPPAEIDLEYDISNTGTS